MALAVGGALLIRIIGRSSGFAIVPTIVAASTAIIAAFAFTWATNPIARISMLQWLQDSTAVARSFPWVGTIRTAGQERAEHRHTPVVRARLAWRPAAAPHDRGRRGRSGRPDRRRRSPASERRTSGRPWYSCRSRCRRSFFPSRSSSAAPCSTTASAICSSPSPRSLPFRRSLSRPSSGRRREGGCCVPRFRSQPSSSSRRASWPRSAGHRTRTRTSTPSQAPNKNGLSWELDYWGVSAKEGVERLRKLGYIPVSVTPAEGVGIPWGATPRPPEARLDGGALRLHPREHRDSATPRRRLRVHGRVHDQARRSRAR